MDLDEINVALKRVTSTIERIKVRIAAHRKELAKNETMTRYALIDPLLRSLGWDTEDPGQVLPECSDGSGGKVDYVLAAEDRPVAVLEAKRLGDPLDRNAVSQAMGYAYSVGTHLLILTNGSEWHLYPIREPDRAKRKGVTFNVERDAAHAAAMEALGMWRQKLAAQDLKDVTLPPDPAGPLPVPGATLEPGAPAPVSARDAGWRPIADVLENFRPKSKPPAGLRLPDGSEVQLRRWKETLVEVAKWLVDKRLIAGSEQIRPPRSRIRNLVSPLKKHAGGKPFLAPASIGSSNFVETNVSAPVALKHSVLLLKHCGVDPAEVHLRFGES